MDHQLPPLPFAATALEPHISAETLGFHHDKHHATYVTNLNKLIAGTPFADNTLEEIITTAPAGGIFNNAAQVWNHTFYWNCLSANGGGPADGAIAAKIDSKFGSFSEFQQQFTQSALTNFGSGWTWLVENSDGSLEIVNTSNAATPLTNGQRPLLTCDVWEHAYYIDYRNARPQYLEAFWKLVNWEFVNGNLS
ncbi:MAG: superoxide dismutase [Fe] [Gammaproteobacteria bacterium]|nr:superoxide dismutase [Fe] [Gammaproteobacteria bacterium]